MVNGEIFAFSILHSFVPDALMMAQPNGRVTYLLERFN
jgi:hypothetical protein